MAEFAVCVNRSRGSGGTEIAGLVAQRLNVHCYDKSLLRLASEDSGINEALFASADEKMKKSLLYLVSRRAYQGELIPPESRNFTSDRNLFNYQAKVIRDLTRSESVVLIGRCANYILRGEARLLRVFVTGPLEKRVRHMTEKYSIDEREARKRIENSDRYRAQYYKFYTGQNWDDPACYDLCLNTETLSESDAAGLVIAAMRARRLAD